jgi:hypothetical protein
MLQNVTTALASAKKVQADANATKVGAERVLAEKKAPLDTLLARIQALKTEIDTLAVEKKRSDVGKGGLAAATRPGS